MEKENKASLRNRISKKIESCSLDKNELYKLCQILQERSSAMPSQPTPNVSNFAVTGYDVTWTNGVFNEVLKFIEKRLSALKWIHKHTIYDFLLWILGFPFGFWVAYKLSDFITGFFGRFSVFVQSAAYVYVFLASLFFFRILFHYGRWIWPMVEYKSPRDRSVKHRLLLSTIFLGLIVAILYDVIKFLL